MYGMTINAITQMALIQPEMSNGDGAKASSSLAYKERHANSAPKIRLATMASHKARDGRLSPRALLIWLVIMMQLVSASQSQSQNIPAPS
jgi:hypothetical protein